MKILVTGGAGYIGSHLVVQLLLKNYDVIIVDSLEKSDIKTLKAIKKITSKKFKFIQGDLKDNNFCKEFIKENIPDTVIHLAAYKSVSEGEIYPDLYYANNVVATQNLIDAMVENKIKNLIFSSTAAVYGQVEDKDLPLNEESIVSPINVYGKTKLEMEKIVKEYALKYGLNATCFRYFNVVGCHESGSMCEDLKYATNLVPVVMKTLIGIQDKVYLFGNDFDTADGSQERDYIDVNDLADAHIKVI
jgi:UDP-glucose 4-epimerase